MSCNFGINRSSLTASLKVASSKYNIPLNNYLMFIYDSLNEDAELTEEFQQKLAEHFGVSIDKINNQYIDRVTDYITDEYNKFDSDVNYSSSKERNYEQIAAFGYNSVYAREFAKHFGLQLVLDARRQIVEKYGSIEKFMEDKKKATGKTSTKLQTYINLLKGGLVNYLVYRALKRGLITDKKQVIDLVNKQDVVGLEQLFGTNHIEDVNLLAMFKELRANTNKFVEEIFRNDGKLRKLIYEKKEDKEMQVQEDTESQEEEEGSHQSSEESDSVDNYIGNLTNKLGDVGHYMSNIDNNIILYFSTINKLTSVNKTDDGKYQYDTNNPLGTPEVMDATQCINTIFSHANAYDVNSLMNEIKRIAGIVPGMEGLVQVADYMKEHPDFAYALWRNFAKTTISKLETTNSNDAGFRARQSNLSVDKEMVLKFDFINAFKITSITANRGLVYDANTKIKDIKREIANKKEALKVTRKQERIDAINKEIDDLIESAIPYLTKAFKAYFNTIQEKAIECYFIDSSDKLNTINFLLGTLNNLNDIAIKSEENYNRIQARAEEIGTRIYELNTEIRKASEALTEAEMNPGSGINRKEIRDIIKKDTEEVEKLTAERKLLYQEDFIDGNFMSKIATFTKEIARYSAIKTDLNSRNVHGNLSSDLINNSMITNILNTLKNPTALANFGKYKQQSRQYDFSNIMVEHRDKNGEIINYGLFTQDEFSKELTPTPYAHRLLREYLYSGIADAENGDGALYAKMSKGDYITSAVFNFFYHDAQYSDETENHDDGGPATFANYFMRIPSDAPKNFVIRAPRYSIRSNGQKQGLFINGKLNTNHPIYIQFRNAFVQEMQDAANAIQAIFGDEAVEGCVPVSLIGKKIDTRNLYENYHYKGDIFGKDDDGRDILTGNVFNSDRFIISEVVQDKDGKYKTVTTNYGELIIKEAFDFFYGGANSIKTKRTNKGVEIIITDAQEEAIAKYLEQFITKYSEQAYNKAMQYNHLFGNNTFDKHQLTEFILNYHLAYINFNDLFEGDTKFYKNSQDALKRFKEVQGSGVAYGLLNYNEPLTADRTPVESSILNKTTFTRKTIVDGEVKEEPIQINQYNRFKAVTIKNTVRTGDSIGTFKLGKKGKPARFKKDDNGNLVEDETGNYIFETVGRLSKKLIEALKENGMSASNAKIHAANTMAGYYGTTVNDAQSYITFEEWVRRIAARGQFEEYKPLIDAILDETKPLDAKTIGKFVQVQKNFYYDQHFNADLQVFAPRQIKNAEFVLVPRLIKGTQLEEVYNLMKEADIDQLNTKETSKAGKCNVLTLWDDNGDITEENKRDFVTNAKGATELFNYNYLYTQQETPSHMAAKNKAGIQFMKKIIDNITPTINGKDNPLWPLKQKFQDLYTENIISSAEEFADELGISIDEHGNFVIDEDHPLDKEMFYDLLREEISRQGLDSNTIDYVTLDEDGMPTMPTFMGNFHKKLESIVQSMINNRITRQTLPGFHAAQITNVGFRPLSDSVDKRIYSKELKYHPTQWQHKETKKIISDREYNIKSEEEKKQYDNIGAAPYIEIMLPKSQFNFKLTKEDDSPKSEEELLQELVDAGLDTIIGYRIPTEGKQSICVMKVVGFIDDAYDSTIVVPDDWVSQTGSDFDIDSVYGISFTTEIDKNGRIIKSKPKTVGPKDYIRYIKKKLKRQLKQHNIDTDVAAKIQEFVDDYNNDAQEEFERLQEESNELFRVQKKTVRDLISKYNRVTVEGKTKKERYINKLKFVIFNLNKELKTNNELTRKQKHAISLYNISINEVYNFLRSQNDDFFEKRDERKEEIYDEVVKQLSVEAEKAGLPTYSKFAERKNRAINRNVRNNDILDTAIQIMQNDNSLEENLNRSNFEKVIEGRDKVQPEYIKKLRQARSPYNFFDQADYQEDAMSGAQLKGASVARDTFVSVCNTIHPYINSKYTIKVVYKAADGYTLKKLRKIFPNVQKNENGDFVVTHNTLGWTLNNRSISSLLLTPYTSQTTAHILDAIKEGAIPNVNNYTFNVYKTFPDIGCDYMLAVAFMMQPAVKRIVDANNLNNSVYAEKSDNSPIKKVILDIANQLMDNTNITFTSFDKTKYIIDTITSHYSELLKNKLHIDFNEHILDFDALNARLNDNKDLSIENLLFDLKVALDFQHIRSLSNKIGDHIRVLNPDKFGAKQSVFETIKAIQDINKLRTDSEILYVTDEENGINRSIISAVYPISGKKSLYPTLNAFYNYSTKLSVQLARLIFDTHRYSFDEFLFSIDDVINKDIDEDAYNNFRNYTLNYVYTNTKAVKCTPVLDTNGEITFDTTSDRRAELARIYGLNKGVNLFVTDKDNKIKTFDVEDINHPKDEEIRQFITLSPAQKVHYIKSKFNKKGIFEYIDEELSGRGKDKNKQKLIFRENVVDIETIYSEFEKAFFNFNPLIKLTAIDLVKYAYAVEGFKMKKGAINKVIKNDAICLNEEDGGLNIAEESSNLVNTLTNIENIDIINQLRTNFIRSHANSKYVTVRKIRSHKTGEFYDKEKTKPKWEKDLIPTSQGIIFITDFDLVEKYGIAKFVGEDIETNHFVILTNKDKQILYRIHNISDTFILTPLNLLEENEFNYMSINNENNTFNSDAWYNLVVEEYKNRREKQQQEIQELYQNGAKDEDILAKEREIRDLNQPTLNDSIASLMAQADLHRFMSADIDTSRYAKPFDINSKDTPYTSGFEQVIDAVKQRFEVEGENLLILRSRTLKHFINYEGVLFGSTQNINGTNYTITKANYWKQNKRYIEDKKEVKEANPDLNDIFLEAQSKGQKVNDTFVIMKANERNSSTSEIDVLGSNNSTDSSTYYNTTRELNTIPSVVDFNYKSIQTLYYRRKSLGDKRAAAALEYLNTKGINPTADEIEKYLPIITQINSEYIVNTVHDIINNLNNFDVYGKNYKIDSDEVIDAIKKDKNLQDKYLQTILDARAFVNTYSLIEQIDVNAEDPQTNKFLKEIKDAIAQLRSSNVISNAEIRMGNDVLSKLSDNPLTQKGVLGVFDGYHTASLFDAWINDLQETSNPLIQIVSKHVIADITKEEMLAKRASLKFRKALHDIKVRASRAGVNIDWDNIFDEEGKFIQKYNKAFLDKMQELRDKKEKAKLNRDQDPKTYYEAALEFEEWKAENIHQEVLSDYYIARNKLERNMLENYTDIYLKYKSLINKRGEIFSHISGGVLADNYTKELELLDQEINNLTSEFFFAGDVAIYKGDYDAIKSFFDNEKDRNTYMLASAKALREYKKKMSELNSKYFTYDSKKGFDTELEANLSIIREREKRDENGHLLTPMSELMKDPDYVKAKKWISDNTNFINTSKEYEELQRAFAVLKEDKKINRKLDTLLIAGLAKKYKAYDEYGVIDASNFTEADIQRIKEEQESTYGIKEQNLFSDRTLITNAPSDDTIFSQEFYNNMRSDGASNPEYMAKVREINTILRPHYNSSTRTINTSKLSKDELVTLHKLYEELDGIKKHLKGTNGKAIHDFIENEVEFVYDQVKYDIEENKAKLRNNQQGQEGYYTKWLLANTELVTDEKGDTKVVPNHFIYGYAVPKGYEKGKDNKYVDKAKTEALRYIKEHTEIVATEYYHQKYREMKNKGEEEFAKWFDANHIFNPYTHAVEPLRCWTTLKLIGQEVKENYFPKYNYLERKPNTGKTADGKQLKDKDGNPLPDMTNYNFNKDAGYAANYNGSNPQYNNNVPQNDYEKEISKLIKDVIDEYAVTTQAKDFFKRGYAPIRQKNETEESNARKVGKELLKLLGWINTSTGKEDWLDDNEVDYSKDTTINMPMSTLLKSKDSVDIKYNPPKRKENETNDEYNARYQEWYDAKNKAQEENREIHKNLLDKNWEEVIEDFIIKAGKFNAIQNNKYLLFYAKNMIDNQQTYVKNLGFNKLQKTGNRDINGSVEYATRTDENLKGQYINWIRRIVYEQYKKPNNRFTRVANTLQSFTSAKYMMLNVSGGLANITQGWTQILGERFAKDYFGSANWYYGVRTWGQGVGSYIYDMYKDNASSKENAIIKFFSIVDENELNSVPELKDPSVAVSRFRDFTFSPLSIGEHFMQNSALFAMLQSHRIYFDAEAAENGRPPYSFKSEGQIRNEAADLAFRDFIKGTKYEALYDAFVKREISKPDYKKEYVWFRKDFTTEFANVYLTASEIKKFNKLKENKQEELLKQFNDDKEHPTIMSQLDMDKDGYLSFKNGSLFATKLTEKEAISLLATFKGRVVSVNKKIHGVYTKLGAAQLENKWGGALVMQYHKHIYPGLMKRWRRQGYFNEERGTVEKGTNIAFLDFISLPLHKAEYVKRLKADTNATDEELKAVEGIQNICKSYIEFLTHFTLYFNLLPAYEQGNILRGLADLAGVAAALTTSVAVQCLGADNDKHGFLYDFLINQSDRLASESMSLRSIGLVGEFKKMWSSPLAAQNLIIDTGKSLALIARYIMQGEDFESEYTSGSYAGEDKLMVLLKRNIPMYHSIYMLERLSKNNKYYKLDQNMLSIIPTKPIADWITK